MLTTLTGENEYARREYIKQQIASFIAKQSELAVEKIDGRATSLEEVSAVLNSAGLFASHKLVIIDQPSLIKGFNEAAYELLDNIDASVEVIINEPKLDKRLALYKYLKAKTDFKEFRALDSAALSNWVKQYVSSHQAKINPADAVFLVDRVGSDQYVLASEIGKLILYDAEISRASIELLTEETPQSTIFQLLEAAFAGHTQNALNIYEQQRALKIEPARILSMLVWQLHIFALVKFAKQLRPEQIAADAGIKPYVLVKSSAVAKRLTASELRRLVKDLLKIDLASKSSPIELDEALKNYLVGLAN